MAGPNSEFWPEAFNIFNANAIYVTLLSADTDFEKYLQHADEFAICVHCNPCKQRNCRFHAILMVRSVENLLERLKMFKFNYQYVDSIFYQYMFLIKNPFRQHGSTFTKLEEAVALSKEHTKMLYQPGIHRKRILRKTFKDMFKNSSNYKNVATQTNLVEHHQVTSFDRRIQTVLNSQYAFDFMRVVDCFVDGLGYVESDLIYFNVKK